MCTRDPDLPSLESRFDPGSLFPGEGPVMDRHILPDHREPRAEQLCEWPRVHEDEGRSALVQGIVDCRERGRGLRGDVEVTGGLEILVDRPRPLETVFVPLLEIGMKDLERFLVAEDGSHRFGVANGRGESDSLELVFRNSTQPLKTDC